LTCAVSRAQSPFTLPRRWAMDPPGSLVNGAGWAAGDRCLCAPPSPGNVAEVCAPSLPQPPLLPIPLPPFPLATPHDKYTWDATARTHQQWYRLRVAAIVGKAACNMAALQRREAKTHYWVPVPGCVVAAAASGSNPGPSKVPTRTRSRTGYRALRKEPPPLASGSEYPMATTRGTMYRSGMPSTWRQRARSARSHGVERWESGGRLHTPHPYTLTLTLTLTLAHTTHAKSPGSDAEVRGEQDSSGKARR
jgi:hypothetical protein